LRLLRIAAVVALIVSVPLFLARCVSPVETLGREACGEKPGGKPLSTCKYQGTIQLEQGTFARRVCACAYSKAKGSLQGHFKVYRTCCSMFTQGRAPPAADMQAAFIGTGARRARWRPRRCRLECRPAWQRMLRHWVCLLRCNRSWHPCGITPVCNHWIYRAAPAPVVLLVRMQQTPRAVFQLWHMHPVRAGTYAEKNQRN
jgi:hypothetical protein